MFRKRMTQKGVGKKANFRWRGGEVSRIEGFSDAVFAFSITLLVVSLEVPRSYEGLMQSLQGFAAFSASFAILIGIWYAHYRFFRRYGLQDGPTIILNAALLFVVLFYIYPLKFLFTLLINYLLLNRALGLDLEVDISIKAAQISNLMTIYSLGFLAVYLIFALLHLHAYRRRTDLELGAVETLITRSSISADGLSVLIAGISIFLANLGGPGFTSLAGWIYCLLGPVHAIYGSIVRKRLVALQSA